MAPNANIINVPIESIERNQYETNYGEGIATVQRQFKDFDHYLTTRNPYPFTSSTYFTVDLISNTSPLQHTYTELEFARNIANASLVFGNIINVPNRTNGRITIDYSRLNRITQVAENDLDTSYDSLPDLVPNNDNLNRPIPIQHIQEQLKTKTKNSKNLFVKPTRPKQQFYNRSNKFKSKQFHSKNAQLQRKCKHTSR
jgi:hypothetical protein